MSRVLPLSERPQGQASFWHPMLDQLLARFDGVMNLKFPDNSSSRFGQRAQETGQAQFSLALRDQETVQSLFLGRDPLRFADANFRGALDIEGDLFAALTLKDYMQSLRLSFRERMQVLTQLVRSKVLPHLGGLPGGVAGFHAAPVHAHTRQENRQSIAFHYDVSNAFYKLWLDPGMVYSCAYFEDASMTLEQAQRAKLDHICRKLQLQPGERFLDIGCGWGSLILHAAQAYGVQAHGITLSEKQFALAQERIAQAGLQSRVTVELRDYRDLEGDARFDKISSVGMFEHVGLKNLPQYFDCVHRLLREGGYFLNHGITHDEEGWANTVSTQFINRYVFPDGQLDTISNIQRVMEQSHFEIFDVEGLRPHYAKTLRHWVHNLEAHHDEALTHVNEATYRVWRLYMAASAMEFEEGALGIYQILCSRRAHGTQAFPANRRFMYPSP